MKFTTVNPATEETIGEYELMGPEEAMGIVGKAHEAFLKWRSVPLEKRAELFRNLAKVMRGGKERYAKLAVIEMGKPLKQAISEVEKCAATAEIYADNAAGWLQEETVQADGKSHFVRFEPSGVILSIMPWNFPFWQAFRFGIPTLMAGNVSVLKHSNIVPRCALAIQEMFTQAGFPQNVYSTVITNHEVIEKAAASPIVQGISLTGSTEAGAKIAALAGKNLKKCVLELGGSDPFIVLEDATVPAAVKHGVFGRTMNNGQSCIAAKRFIVHKSIADNFTKEFTAQMRALVVGDPMDIKTDVGPLANRPGVEAMEHFVKEAVSLGAEILCGGKRREGKGYFFEPTVLGKATPAMKVFRDEVFGPIAPIIVFSTDKEAIELANNSEFGLGASIWTSNLGRGKKMGEQIEAGDVFINSIVKSDARMPFGGVKKSGIGRELSKYGLREFTNIKGYNLYEGQ